MVGDMSFIALGVGDPERGRTFFEGLFGWRVEPARQGFGIEMPNVPAACTAATPRRRRTRSSPSTTSSRRSSASSRSAA